MVGEQPEVSIRRDEGEDPLSFPALEPNTWVETDIIQQPRILGEGDNQNIFTNYFQLVKQFYFHFLS